VLVEPCDLARIIGLPGSARKAAADVFGGLMSNRKPSQCSARRR
jgi:hypothetical protein